MSFLPTVSRRVSLFLGALVLATVFSFSFNSELWTTYAIQRPGRSWQTPRPTRNTGIPPKIWQIYFPHSKVEQDLLDFMGSWLTVNPDTAYSRLSRQGALDFVIDHYSHRPDIVQLYTDLQVSILAIDLLRYMILAAEGGVYADTDTRSVTPIKNWVPKSLRRKAAAVVGIEYDRLNDTELTGGMFMDVQFCQWTIAAAKGHPLLEMAVEEVTAAIRALAERQQCAISELEPTQDDVLTTTGPAIWSKMVFKSLSIAEGRNVSFEDVSGLEEPTLFGDILVLPIDGFATGMSHSGSGRHGEQALIRHGFKGSWRDLESD